MKVVPQELSSRLRTGARTEESTELTQATSFTWSTSKVLSLDPIHAPKGRCPHVDAFTNSLLLLLLLCGKSNIIRWQMCSVTEEVLWISFYPGMSRFHYLPTNAVESFFIVCQKLHITFSTSAFWLCSLSASEERGALKYQHQGQLSLRFGLGAW